MIRETVHFTGHVQGVGFRYTTVSLARAHPVAGYVRNLADGRVQLVVEGEPARVDAFIVELVERMRQYIRQVTRDRCPATGDFGIPGPGALRIRH